MTKPHIHQYKRLDIGKDKEYIVFKCALPNCAHYLAPYLVVGRESLCPRCEESFIIENKHLQLAQPHCDNCTIKKTNDEEVTV